MMVNRESLPLILALLVPIVLVLLILLYVSGYDIFIFFTNIVILPIALGFTAGIIKYLKKG